MYLLGLDFETTGLDTDKDLVTEVGLVLWDTHCSAPVVVEDYFVNWRKIREDFTLSDEIVQKTGIQQAYLEQFGVLPLAGLNRLAHRISQCAAIVAHNGTEFDRKMYTSWFKHLEPYTPHIPPQQETKLWIDTTCDVEFEGDFTTRKLTYLAAEHGFLNPWAHRAVFDVLTMMKVLSQYDLDRVVWSANHPTVQLQAIVSYDEKESAKERGFRWDSDNKRWIKSVKLHKLESATAELPFRTRVLA